MPFLSIAWNISLVTCVFLVYTLALRRLSTMRKTSDWLPVVGLPWYTTQKRCITSTYLKHYVWVSP